MTTLTEEVMSGRTPQPVSPQLFTAVGNLMAARGHTRDLDIEAMAAAVAAPQDATVAAALRVLAFWRLLRRDRELARRYLCPRGKIKQTGAQRAATARMIHQGPPPGAFAFRREDLLPDDHGPARIAPSAPARPVSVTLPARD
jgi:hypothetical protein